MNKVVIPGAAWVALIVAVTGLLSGWLSQWVQHPLVPLAVLVLGMIAKAVEMLWPKPTGLEALAPKSNGFFRFLFG